MTNRGALPDLVRDKELTTTTESNLTIHHRRHGRRSIRETWKHDNVTLGQGGYGVVWRERRVNSQSDDLGEPGPEVRAVKRIHILDSRTLSEDKHYLRELEALAKFSQDKVGPNTLVSKIGGMSAGWRLTVRYKSIPTTSSSSSAGTRFRVGSTWLWNTVNTET